MRVWLWVDGFCWVGNENVWQFDASLSCENETRILSLSFTALRLGKTTLWVDGCFDDKSSECLWLADDSSVLKITPYSVWVFERERAKPHTDCMKRDCNIWKTILMMIVFLVRVDLFWSHRKCLLHNRLALVLNCLCWYLWNCYCLQQKKKCPSSNHDFS